MHGTQLVIPWLESVHCTGFMHMRENLQNVWNMSLQAPAILADALSQVCLTQNSCCTLGTV